MELPRRLGFAPKKSYFLLGPHQTGKSTLLRHVKSTQRVDLLHSDSFYKYASRPSALREELLAQRSATTVIIDEVQRVPDLIHEVHWLLENSAHRFLLSGSSARKLRRSGVTNLAGRLVSARLFPLTMLEIPEYDLVTRLQFGSLPPAVVGDDPVQFLRDYTGEYLREEIQAESRIQNLVRFGRFLETTAIGNGELLAYATVARDVGVSAHTIRAYFDLLEDTLIGYRLEPWTRTKKRRAILTEKFYLCDTGIVHHLVGRKLSPKTPEFGASFEHAIVLETLAARAYEKHFERVCFWRDAAGYEVDLLLDDHTAIEIKSGKVGLADTKGLQALAEELRLRNRWIVSTEPRVRQLENGVLVLPYKDYAQRIAGGDF